MRIAVVAITRRGALLADRLCRKMAGLEFYLSSRYACLAEGAHNLFEPAELKPLIATIWRKYDGLVLIMASGIVVRMIAPLLKSKATDPAVIVMDDAGCFAISLLSGHLGGANDLAKRCADVSGARSVITTATDANDLPSFDMLAKEYGWIIDDLAKVKHLNTLLLDNEEIAVVDPSGQTRAWLRGRGCVSFYETFSEAVNSSARGFLFVTNAVPKLPAGLNKVLILRPRNLVLGIGCNRDTALDEIADLVSSHLAELTLSIKSVCCVASIAAKRDEAGLTAFARQLDVPFRCFESNELHQVVFPSPPSEHALVAVGVAGVAEPAAILASGGGRLLLHKVKSPNVTLAITELKEGFQHDE